jgi:PAS domain-containing protein
MTDRTELPPPASGFAGSAVPFAAGAALLLAAAAAVAVVRRRRRRHRPLPSPPTTAARLFRLLFDSLPAPAWAFDEDSLRFVAVNDAVLRRFGYSRDALLRLGVRDVCPDDDADRLAAGPGGPSSGGTGARPARCCRSR